MRPVGMRAAVTIFAVMSALAAAPRAASAEAVAGGYARPSGGPFGLGVIVGAPTGLSANYFLSGNTALDFAAGLGFSHLEGLQLHADILWYPHVLAERNDFRLPWYIGVGPVTQFDDDNAALGVRVPVGLLFAFTGESLGAFIEFAPGVETIHDPGFRFDAAAGVRFYF